MAGSVETSSSDGRPKQGVLLRIGRNIRHPINRWFGRQSLVDDTPLLDPACLPALEELRQNWNVVAEELAPLIAEREQIPAFGKISPDHRRIASSPAWKSFFFQGYGFHADANRSKCPQTSAMLDRIPGLVVAFFSIMEPNTHVPSHRGLTKAWINCHLPIMVPKGPERCEMDVAGTLVHWREGEWLLFDETNPHEVWNETGEVRVVLFLQVMRPMRWPGRFAARIIHGIIRRSRFVQDVRREIGS